MDEKIGDTILAQFETTDAKWHRVRICQALSIMLISGEVDEARVGELFGLLDKVNARLVVEKSISPHKLTLEQVAEMCVGYEKKSEMVKVIMEKTGYAKSHAYRMIDKLAAENDIVCGSGTNQ